MYSMVLLAALTTGTDLPDCGRRGGCCGCYGGYGWGGWGGCYGGYGWGGWGGYGGWGGGWGGGYGGWGGWGGWGYAYAPSIATYAAPVMLASNSIPAAGATRSLYFNPGSATSNRATITVHLPDNATLKVDGKPTSSLSTTRHFYSPPLQPGKTYHYNLQALVQRDGKTVTIEKRVEVRAGANREVTLTLANADQSAERQPAPQSPETTEVPERRVRRD